jgi:hypothetical protein
MVQTIRHVNTSKPTLLYFGAVMAGFQVLFCWWFTSGIVFVKAAPGDDDDKPAQ